MVDSVGHLTAIALIGAVVVVVVVVVVAAAAAAVAVAEDSENIVGIEVAPKL
jgi:hypothetical protein